MNAKRSTLTANPCINPRMRSPRRQTHPLCIFIWTASSEFGTYRLCEQQRFRRACASAQSRQNLLCSLIQAVNQEEPSDRKPDPWPLWMAGHAQLKFVMTECSKTQIRLTGPIYPILLQYKTKIKPSLKHFALVLPSTHIRCVTVKHLV